MRVVISQGGFEAFLTEDLLDAGDTAARVEHHAGGGKNGSVASQHPPGVNQ